MGAARSEALAGRLAAASEAWGLAGWLVVDLGERAAGWYYREAVACAQRSGMALLEAYMLGSMSLWAAGLGKGDRAVALAGQAGSRLSRRGPVPLSASGPGGGRARRGAP